MGSGSHNSGRPKRAGTAGTPARQRELRAQGRKTMRRLLDAGMRVFAERGYHQRRVDDIVRAARTSHGTFYLYFANKEDLLRALAVDCAQEMEALAERASGRSTRRRQGSPSCARFLGRFFDDLPALRRRDPGVDGGPGQRPRGRPARGQAFTHIASALGRRMEESGAPQPVDSTASVAALMALLERFSYAVVVARPRLRRRRDARRRSPG